MGTHLYDCLNSFERMLEGHQELSKEVLKKFGGHVQCNRCKFVNFIDVCDIDSLSLTSYFFLSLLVSK